MDKSCPFPVAFVGGLIMILLGELLTIRGKALQSKHESLEEATKVIEFALLVGLTGAIANVVQNELTNIYGINPWGFLVGGGVGALLVVYGEQIIDRLGMLPESQLIELGITICQIGFIIVFMQLYYRSMATYIIW